MNHYRLGEVRTVESNLFDDVAFDDNVVMMKVQEQSCIRNILGFATNKIKRDDVKQITWYGEGLSAQKAVNCAEVMKRKQNNLYMLSRNGYKRVEEYWDPIEDSGLDRLKVNTDTDTVCVLLSKLPLDDFKHEKGFVGLKADAPNPKNCKLHNSKSKSQTKLSQTKHPQTKRSQTNQRLPNHSQTRQPNQDKNSQTRHCQRVQKSLPAETTPELASGESSKSSMTVHSSAIGGSTVGRQ